MQERRAIVIVNPISGHRSRLVTVEGLAAGLARHGVLLEVWPTEGPGDARRLARKAAAEGVDMVVAAGGDGTVNETAHGLLESGGAGTHLGILPFGTSNLVARELAIPLDPQGAAAVLATGEPVRMDVGIVNGRPFLACVGVGWDAHVVRNLSASRKGHIRFHSYLGPMLRAAFKYPFHRLTVTTAEGETAAGELAIVLNARPYAAFFTPVPQARSDDGFLDCLVLEKRGALDLPRWLWRGLRGTLSTDKCATVLRSTGFRIDAEEPIDYQIDGDVGAETPVDILVRPGALRVLAPAPLRDQEPPHA